MTNAHQLQQVATDIWIVDGETVSFYGFPYPTRMTIVRLPGGRLFVHSPIGSDPGLFAQIEALGEVRYLVSPNKIHHLFMGDWSKRYPQAELYASPGLARKRKDLSFVATLTDTAPDAWKDEIEQVVLKGSPFMKEVAFFHRASRTMIVADMIERLEGKGWSWWMKILGRLDGLMGAKGGMPKEWRASFLNRKKARKDLARMIAWDPQRIIIAHGPCVDEDGADYLKMSFRWLLKSA